MKKRFGRAVALALVSIGALTAPTPAFADLEQLGECLQVCRQAHASGLYGPGFLQMCTANCIALYGNDGLTAGSEGPLAVLRYD